MADYTATCHTQGCGNQGIAIPMTWDAEAQGQLDFVACGVCGQYITDVDPPDVVRSEPGS